MLPESEERDKLGASFAETILLGREVHPVKAKLRQNPTTLNPSALASTDNEPKMRSGKSDLDFAAATRTHPNERYTAGGLSRIQYCQTQAPARNRCNGIL